MVSLIHRMESDQFLELDSLWPPSHLPHLVVVVFVCLPSPSPPLPQALSHVSPTSPWSTSTLHFASLHLQPGVNTVSVELHAASPHVDHAFFDLALSAVGSLACATTT